MTKLKKGEAAAVEMGVIWFTCLLVNSSVSSISHSLLKMVLVMLMRMVKPAKYDKDVVLVVYVAFVGNGVKARPV